MNKNQNTPKPGTEKDTPVQEESIKPPVEKDYDELIHEIEDSEEVENPIQDPDDVIHTTVMHTPDLNQEVDVDDLIHRPGPPDEDI